MVLKSLDVACLDMGSLRSLCSTTRYGTHSCQRYTCQAPYALYSCLWYECKLDLQQLRSSPAAETGILLLVDAPGRHTVVTAH